MEKIDNRIRKYNNSNDLYTSYCGNGIREYSIARNGDVILNLKLQIDEDVGVGIVDRDLLEIVRNSLQNTKPSRENSLALTHLEEALMWLDKK